jgi:hypothetical protein
VLVSAHYGAVDHGVFVVGIGGEMLKQPLPTPDSAQRLKRRWTFFQSPKRSGKSRQGMPTR